MGGQIDQRTEKKRDKWWKQKKRREAQRKYSLAAALMMDALLCNTLHKHYLFNTTDGYNPHCSSGRLESMW